MAYKGAFKLLVFFLFWCGSPPHNHLLRTIFEEQECGLLEFMNLQIFCPFLDNVVLLFFDGEIKFHSNLIKCQKWAWRLPRNNLEYPYSMELLKLLVISLLRWWQPPHNNQSPFPPKARCKVLNEHLGREVSSCCKLLGKRCKALGEKGLDGSASFLYGNYPLFNKGERLLPPLTKITNPRISRFTW